MTLQEHMLLAINTALTAFSTGCCIGWLIAHLRETK